MKLFYVNGIDAYYFCIMQACANIMLYFDS